MIPAAVVAALVTALLLTTVFPIVLLIVLGVRRRITPLPLLVGFAAFFVSQIVLRLPLLQLLGTQAWWRTFAEQTLPYLLTLAVSAALFEEGARLGGVLLLRGHRTWRDAVSLGLGHGLCEVILLIGMTHVNNVLFCLLINLGGSDQLAAILPADQLAVITAQLQAVQPLDIALSLVERISAVLFHILAAVLVFDGVIGHRAGPVLLAVAAHTVFNLVGVLLTQVAGPWIAEAALLLLALAGGWAALQLRPHFAAPGGKEGAAPC